MPLLAPDECNPWTTTTRGTGELMFDAMTHYSPTEILLTLGGSATVDGGIGAATALGWRFLDEHGKDVECGGRGLGKIRRIVRPELAMQLPRVRALCDVDNPLCGERGAAAVYAPQKGADPEMVVLLEHGLANLADCIERDLGMSVADVPGAGAAGGFGAGAMAFFDAELCSGIETVLDVLAFDHELEDADWVITGEGRFDRQSLYGKVVSGICAAARRSKVRVGVVAGCMDDISEDDWRGRGIEFVVATSQNADFDDVRANGARYAVRSVKQILPHLQ